MVSQPTCGTETSLFSLRCGGKQIQRGTCAVLCDWKRNMKTHSLSPAPSSKDSPLPVTFPEPSAYCFFFLKKNIIYCVCIVLCVCFWPFRRLEEDLSSLELKLKAIVTRSTWFWAPNMGKNSTCLNGHLSRSFIGCFFFFTLKVIPRRCQLLRIHRRLPR